MSLAILDAILAIDWSDIGLATVETLTMVGGSLFFTVLLGLPLGIVLFLTGPRQPLATDRQWDPVAVYAPDEFTEEEFQDLYAAHRPHVAELGLKY